MEFDELVISKLGHIFERYAWRLTGRSKHLVCFDSEHLNVRIAYDYRDRSSCLFIASTKHPSSIEIRDKVLSGFFESDLKLEQVATDVFLNNVVLFFEGSGRPLLENDMDRMDALADYSYALSREYTDSILTNQNVTLADRAWAVNDYNAFIKYIDRLDSKRLSPSYLLKYKIAREKLQG